MGYDTKGKFNDGFLMSPKVDFVFKLLFGDEKNKDILTAFLSAVLKMPQEDFAGIEIVNSELLREFKEDRKGILDVRVKTKAGKQIDIEIQIVPTEYMPERTLFYWSKLYNGQIKSGETYDKLKKCITINIVDFECIPIKKLHTSFHVIEDETGYRLTDILEVHFLELPKLFKEDIEKNENDPIVEWMEFLDGKSKGVMEMLAKKNGNIKKAYDLLQVISQDDNARMAYEAREAEIRDQMTRMKSAEERGKTEGKTEDATNLLKLGVSIGIITKATGLSEEKVIQIKKELES